MVGVFDAGGVFSEVWLLLGVGAGAVGDWE